MKKELLQTAIRWVNQVLDSFEGGDDASEIDGKDLICELIGELHGTQWESDGTPVPDDARERALQGRVTGLQARITELEKLLTDTKIQNENAAAQLRASGEELNRVNRAKLEAERTCAALRSDLKGAHDRCTRSTELRAEALRERQEALEGEAKARRELGAEIVALRQKLEAATSRADAKTVTINLNDAVRCELTEQGKSLVMSDLSANRGGKPWSTRWQLWELFAVFGKHFPGYPRFGFAPFVDNNITFPYVPEAERVNAENVAENVAVYVGPKP